MMCVSTADVGRALDLDDAQLFAKFSGAAITAAREAGVWEAGNGHGLRVAGLGAKEGLAGEDPAGAVGAWVAF